MVHGDQKSNFAFPQVKFCGVFLEGESVSHFPHFYIGAHRNAFCRIFFSWFSHFFLHFDHLPIFTFFLNFLSFSKIGIFLIIPYNYCMFSATFPCFGQFFLHFVIFAQILNLLHIFSPHFYTFLHISAHFFLMPGWRICSPCFFGSGILHVLGYFCTRFVEFLAFLRFLCLFPPQILYIFCTFFANFFLDPA